MKAPWKTITVAAVALAVTAVAATPDVQAKKFYKGKVITLIVPNSPGGKMTRYARTYAPFIAKYAGAKNVRIVNKKGGGGVKGTNLLWTKKPDGKTIGFTSVPTLILAQLSGSKAVKFDATKFVYLGRAATEPRVMLAGKKSGLKSIKDMKNAGRKLKSASQGTDEDFYTIAVLSKAFGLNVQYVTGYEGMNDVALATIKGDSDFYMISLKSARGAIKAGDLVPVLMFWDKRVNKYPNVPNALELVSGSSKEAVQAIVDMLTMHRGFFGPPGFNKKATKALRAAIWKTSKDTDFLKKAKKKRLIIVPSHGKDEQKKIVTITAASQGIEGTLKAALDSIK